jgi:glycerol-3-phosphate acyltransferase PlsY
LTVLPAAAAAYLAGCVPVASLVGRFGSGRAWVPWVAAAADVLKGYLVVMVISPAHPWGVAVGSAAVLAGHLWPLRGRAASRRPLAVAAGVFAAISPVAIPAGAVLWALVYVVTGYLALAAAATVLLLPVVVGLVAGWPMGLLLVPACVLVLDRLRPDAAGALAGRAPRHLWRSPP